MRHLATIAAILPVLCAGRVALADGMAYVERSAAGGTGEVGKAVPTAQRAVLVRDGDSWSLTLEAKYDRPQAGAGWLVPFPHCPTVAEADPRILTELGIVTAPIFVNGCFQTCQCDSGHTTLHSSFACGGGGGASAPVYGTEEEATRSGGSGAIDVDVWQSGSIGALDFVVLSAADPADIPRWLDDNGYQAPPEVAAFVTDNAQAYGCYFAAKLGTPASRHDVFPAVRFDLDDRDPPFYPLRLTRLGLEAGQTLDVTLWVVAPVSDSGGNTRLTAPAITDFPIQTPACLAPTGRYDPDQGGDALPNVTTFGRCLETFHQQNPGQVAVTFNGSLWSRQEIFTGRRTVACDYDGSECLRTDVVLRDVPTTWTPTMTDWLGAGIGGASYVWLSRYEVRLPPESMARDMVLDVGGPSAYNFTFDPTYLLIDNDCGDDCDHLCGDTATGAITRRSRPVATADTASLPVEWLVLALPLLVLVARRRRGVS
jgi:hypothetical protein